MVKSVQIAESAPSIVIIVSRVVDRVVDRERFGTRERASERLERNTFQ